MVVARGESEFAIQDVVKAHNVNSKDSDGRPPRIGCERAVEELAVRCHQDGPIMVVADAVDRGNCDHCDDYSEGNQGTGKQQSRRSLDEWDKSIGNLFINHRQQLSYAPDVVG